jgi:outer membrane murein-binding lipoprotein Lpp
MRFTAAIVLTCILVACANAPLPNQIEAASSVAADLAGQIDRLQHQGVISNEQEDRLLDRLA